ncbi:MAG TPA: gliding motility lipoprotein GldH [Bacteroidia bacterium]|nr:gliding motility lipoprotein GldH [Bacteroidia bacterium]
MMRKLFFKPLFFSGLILITLSSCDKNRVFEKNQKIPNNTWDVKNSIKFQVPISDTITPTNFYVNIRNTDNYPYRNIYLFITTQFPDGGKAVDTLECILADQNGKWLGSGLGDIWDNQILFKKNVRFPHPGNYIFEFQQAMRTEQLPEIMDVGLRIEKVRR